MMLLENDEIASDMKRALKLMNITFIIVVAFMCGLIYQFVISEKTPIAGSEEINATQTMLILGLTYLASFIFPTIGIINDAVKSDMIIEEKCLQKLKLVELNVLFLE